MCELATLQHVFAWIGAAVVSIWSLTLAWLAAKALAYSNQMRMRGHRDLRSSQR